MKSNELEDNINYIKNEYKRLNKIPKPVEKKKEEEPIKLETVEGGENIKVETIDPENI